MTDESGSAFPFFHIWPESQVVEEGYGLTRREVFALLGKGAGRSC